MVTEDGLAHGSARVGVVFGQVLGHGRAAGRDRFDAILPPGTGAILAVGASRPTVVATADGAIAVKRQMQVNLTADHRHIYGTHAAAFLKDLAQLIETNPESLAL